MGSESEALLNLELPEELAAASAARKALASLNGSLHLISDTRLVDAQLLVSELVSNAIRHGGQPGAPVAVRAQAARHALRVEVTDAGEGFAPSELPLPSRSRGGGWGLHIVALLADRWGVKGDGHTTVWFEIARPQRDEAPPAELVPAE